MSHQMPSPSGIANLDDLLRQEIAATKQHWNGVTNVGAPMATIGLSADFVEQVPHAPQLVPSRLQREDYRQAVTRYHAAMAEAINALEAMKRIAARGREEFDTARAMAKQAQTQHVRVARRSI